jgi:hypothetical protein
MKASMMPKEQQSPVQKANKDTEAVTPEKRAPGSSMAPPTFQLKAGAPIQKADDDKWTKVKEVLEMTETGKEALKRKDDLGIPVEFKAGGGSYHSAGKIVIDSDHAPQRAALSFVHEMNHAYWFKKGMQANITTETRAAYIDKKINEESEGVVKSIECKMELEGSKVSTTGLSYPLEAEYKAAYKKSYDDAIAAKKSEADAKTGARIAGLAAVKQGFIDGKVSTSTDGKSYPTYYGDAWDKAHKNDPK